MEPAGPGPQKPGAVVGWHPGTRVPPGTPLPRCRPRGLLHPEGCPTCGENPALVPPGTQTRGMPTVGFQPPSASGAFVPAGVFSRLQALQARSQRRPFPGRRPFRTTRPRSRQIHYCTEKTQVLIVVYVLFFCFIPVSDPVSKDHGSTPALATPLPHRLRLLLLTLELLG